MTSMLNQFFSQQQGRRPGGGLTNQFLSANAGPAQSANPGTTNRGICTLTFQGRTLQFRTNPNSIWWDYELIRNVEQTYGGRVIQLLGVRLGDLQVKVDCGRGGWDYQNSVVQWLREMMSDQRNGVSADFQYTTRNWHLKVYAMTIPFDDEVEATVRELTLNFKIQEDVNNTLSRVSLSTEIARLKDGIYGPGEQPHNRYNDPAVLNGPLAGMVNPSGPVYAPSGIVNTVDSTPMGSWTVGGIGTGLGFLPSIPGLGSLGGLGGMLGGLNGLGGLAGGLPIPGLSGGF